MKNSFSIVSPQSLVCFIILFFSSLSSYAQIDVITARRKSVDSATYAHSGTYIKSIISTSGISKSTDGLYFNDIDYLKVSTTSYLQINHLLRLAQFAAAYNQVGNTYYHRTEFKDTICKLFQYWVAISPKAGDPNWSYSYLHIPKYYGAALLQMRSPHGEKFGFGADTLKRFALARSGRVSDFNHLDTILSTFAVQTKTTPTPTGANRSDYLKASMYRALLSGDTTLLHDNVDSFYVDSKIQTNNKDGIQPDGTYYIHFTQVYNYGYGNQDMKYKLEMYNITRNTTYDDTKGFNTVIDCILDGFQWLAFKKEIDFGTNGRVVSAANSLSFSVSYLLDVIKNFNYRKSELQYFYDSSTKGTMSFPTPGIKHFWKGDMMVSQNKDFYLSAKVSSTRTVGTEALFPENLKCNYLPWGATNIMVDGNEYLNIPVLWDWNKIPGVTSTLAPLTSLFSNGYTWALLYSNISFAGGVTNGKYGMAAYDFTSTGINSQSNGKGYTATYVAKKAVVPSGITARKVYFFTPQVMYCMGAGITGNQSANIVTTINQCNSSGQVAINTGANTYAIFADTLKSFTDLNWIFHNKVGYYFPQNGNVTVRNTIQNGNYYNINQNQTNATVSGKVFSLWFDHGKTPSNATYEYMVVPNQSMSQFTANNTLKKLVNTTSTQGFFDAAAGVYGVSFYVKGTVTLTGADLNVAGGNLTLTVSQPCLVLLEKNSAGTGYTISVSDPTQLLTSVTLTLSGAWTGTNATLSGTNTQIVCNLPTGDNAGKSLTNVYTNNTKVSTAVESIEMAGTNGKIVVYPNPCVSRGPVSLRTDESTEIKINSIDGKELFRQWIEAGTTQIYPNLQQGIYMLISKGLTYKLIVR